MDPMQPPDFLKTLFQSALDAVSSESCLPGHLPSAPLGRTVVIGAGKAAAAMAHTVEKYWHGPLSGLVITRYGHGVPCRHIEVIEAAHPVPDAAGLLAAKRLLSIVDGLNENDLVICLISGGGSALMPVPGRGITLNDKQSINSALLKSGANISEMNCVRKHLSAIKGGRLAIAAAPARVVTLLISDVPGDDPSTIASGPTIGDATTLADARGVIEKYDIPISKAVRTFLRDDSNETPKPSDPVFDNNTTVMLASAQMSLEAAAHAAKVAGVTPVILGNSIEGEARDIAAMHAGIARQVALHGQPARAPCVLLSGGETTVTVRGKGRGGRNSEFLLALAIELNGRANIHALACDTDGIDGTQDNAGCLISPDTLLRARALGIDAKACLANNDGYGFFTGVGDLLVTGPTRTNVNDFRAVLIV